MREAMINRFVVSGKVVKDICGSVVPQYFEAFLRQRAKERNIDVGVIEVKRPDYYWPQELLDHLVDQEDPEEKQRINDFHKKWERCIVDGFLEYLEKDER